MTRTTTTADPALAVRPAGPADAPALAALRWEFRAALASSTEERDAFVARCAAWMRPRLADGDAWRAWVAEAAGEIVGTVWLQWMEKMPNPVGEPEIHGYITNLYVRESARGGAGSRLLAAALDACDAAGVHQCFLWPTQRSRTLYRRHGFTGDGEVMVRRGTGRFP